MFPFRVLSIPDAILICHSLSSTCPNDLNSPFSLSAANLQHSFSMQSPVTEYLENAEHDGKYEKAYM